MIGMELLIKLMIVWTANVFLSAKMRGSSTHRVPEIGRVHRAGPGNREEQDDAYSMPRYHNAIWHAFVRAGTGCRSDSGLLR